MVDYLTWLEWMKIPRRRTCGVEVLGILEKSDEEEVTREDTRIAFTRGICTVVEKRSEIIDAIATGTDSRLKGRQRVDQWFSPSPFISFLFRKITPRWPPFCLHSKIACLLLGNWPKITADRRLLCGHGLNFALPQKYHWLPPFPFQLLCLLLSIIFFLQVLISFMFYTYMKNQSIFYLFSHSKTWNFKIQITN